MTGDQGLPPGRLDRLFGWIAARRWRALLTYALLAAALRLPLVGDWNYDVDVQFYLLVGRRMLDGAVLYVDVWDRKPPLLYLIYAVCAASLAPVAAMLLATAAAAALTAYGVHRLARPHAGDRGSLLAGFAALFLALEFGGASGQAAQLLAPLMVGAFWSVSASLPALARGTVPRRIYAGMACAGLALAMKQSALVEGAALGLATLVLARRGGATLPRLLRAGAGMALCGALPLVLAAGWYLSRGQFSAMWQALVLSTAARTFESGGSLVARYGILVRALAPALFFAALGVAAMAPVRKAAAAWRLALFWLTVAVLALVVYPNLYLHYALPLLAPLCLVAAPCFARRDIGLAAAVLVGAVALYQSGLVDPGARARSRQASATLTAYLAAEAPHRRVLAWNFSPWLYALGATPPPTALLFPPHLYDGAEAGASGRDPAVELARVLAWRPEVVVVQRPVPARPINPITQAMVEAYVRQCRQMRRFTLFDHNGAQPQFVYSRCPGSTGAVG